MKSEHSRAELQSASQIWYFCFPVVSFAVPELDEIAPTIRQDVLRMIGKAPSAPLLKIDKADQFSISIGYSSSLSHIPSVTARLRLYALTVRTWINFSASIPVFNTFHVPSFCLTLLSGVECDPPYKSEQAADWGSSFTAWNDEQFQACISPVSDVLKLNKCALAVALSCLTRLSDLSLCFPN